jgi:hypothetical protein
MRAAVTLVLAMVAARSAAADPADARVLTVPTAWLLGAGDAHGTLAIDHRGDTAAMFGYGLGGLAELEVGSDSDIRGCSDCTARPAPVVRGRAAFRIGARQNAWFTGMPALVFGVRTTFAARREMGPEQRASDAYVVASRALGVVRLHAGVDALSASAGAMRTPARLRPLAALEIRPPMYPRSSLLGDLAWEPTLDAQHGPTLAWMLGIGVRYQAFAWASVELAVRARQSEELGTATVMLRVNAHAQR